MTERKMRVLLAKGGLDGHDRGIMIVAKVLKDTGVEIIYTGLYQSPEEIVSASLEEDVDMIGISMLSGAHNYVFSRVLKLLKESRAEEKIVFGGGIIYTKDLPYLKEIGVKEVFLPGTPTQKIVDFVKGEGEKMAKAKKDESRELIKRVAKGDKLAGAVLMTMVENKDYKTRRLLEKTRTLESSLVVGITGSAGVGKSSLIDKIIKHLREDGKTVGVITCDPSSPITGGAFLGDRIRMQDHFTDPDVFIRSLATRGFGGGLAEAVQHVIKIMKLLNKDIILVETVGVGQTEVAVKKLVDILLLVLSPGLGDEIQMLKSGLIEVGDILVLNKADQPEAERIFNILQTNFGDKKILICKTNAIKGEGIQELVQKILALNPVRN